MADPIEALFRAWKATPSPTTTAALCNALRADPRDALVQQVGEFAKRRHSTDVPVLLAVARMYIEANRFMDAQATLVAAGKQAPREAKVYRWLGEVLLRRGDAERAEKVLDRLVLHGVPDPDVKVWLERARSYRPMQKTAGARAVAAEVAHAHATKGRAALSAARPTADSDSDETETDVFAPVDTSEIEVSTPPPVKAAAPRRTSSAPPRPTSSAPPRPTSSAPPRPTSSVPPRPTSSVSPRPVSPASPRRVTTPPPLPASSVPPQPVAAAAPARAPSPPTVPHPRDVLDALALAGVFEPTLERPGGGASWDDAARAPKRTGAPWLVVAMALFLGASVGVYFFYRAKRAREHVQAEALLGTVEARLRAAKPSELADAENELTRVFQLESRSQRAALDWARERATRGLVKNGADIAFEDAMARAKEVGVPEEKYAFARVASFLFQGDTAGAAAMLPRWEAAAADDAWYQLVAGATLERAGDARARDRYARASKLDPELFAAKEALARSTAMDGDVQDAMRVAKAMRAAMPDRAEPIALVALAWGRDSQREDIPAPSEAADVAKRKDELPSGLRFVPHAIGALGAIDRRDASEARAEVESGLAVAESPGAAVWLGTIAVSVGDEALARKAALLALQVSAAYEPARALAARIALLGGRIDEALKATEDLDPTSTEVAVVRCASAYERGDTDGVARALEALPPDARRLPVFAALDLAEGALSGKVRLDAGKRLVLAGDDAPWADLVAMDVSLDDGDLASADKIALRWGKDGESRPLRALRLARLARYEGRLEAADALSQTALVRAAVTPRVLEERVFLLVAKGRSTEVPPLLARYPLVLGPLATWLSAYASASGGNVEVAKGRTASLDPPPPGAPLHARIVAASALGATKERRRGGEYVRELLASGNLDPDVVAAALALGFHKIDRGKRPPLYQ